MAFIPDRQDKVRGIRCRFTKPEPVSFHVLQDRERTEEAEMLEDLKHHKHPNQLVSPRSARQAPFLNRFLTQDEVKNRGVKTARPPASPKNGKGRPVPFGGLLMPSEVNQPVAKVWTTAEAEYRNQGIDNMIAAPCGFDRLTAAPVWKPSVKVNKDHGVPKQTARHYHLEPLDTQPSGSSTPGQKYTTGFKFESHETDNRFGKHHVEKAGYDPLHLKHDHNRIKRDIFPVRPVDNRPTYVNRFW